MTAANGSYPKLKKRGCCFQGKFDQFPSNRAIAEGNAPAHPHDIDAEGMQLYATVDNNDFHHKYRMPPHTMAVATVNLAQDWRTIEARLLEVIGSMRSPDSDDNN